MTAVKSNTARFDTENRLRLGEKYGDIYLTERELDILRLVVQGYTAKCIAKKLEISFRTVESYITQLRAKFHCSTKSEIIQICLQNGIFKLFFEDGSIKI